MKFNDMSVLTNKQIENCLNSELRSMLDEFNNNTLTEESIINYFRLILGHAQLDSHIIVNVLENFGELGKEEALSIKVTEGW